MDVIDLRSDTITRPTPGMLEAMACAPLGDDVLGDDPSVAALQDRVADLFGMQAALFVPSGTMANQLAIRCRTEPGDAVIAHELSHVIRYEVGAPAALSGALVIAARGERGIFGSDEVERLFHRDDGHGAPTRLVVLENTHNLGGGSVWPIQQLADVCARAHALGMRTHLDGARIWNAAAAAGVPLREFGRHCDTIACCFSKGLGAPVGSALVGPADLIARARRFRQMLGGGMRQAGILAAAALYALDHHLPRIADDHVSARAFADALAGVPRLAVEPVQTNMVYFTVDGDAQALCDSLRASVRMFAEGPRRVRAVFHLHVTPDQAREAARRIAHALS